MKIQSILIALLIVTSSAFAGGGWPQPKKKFYAKLGQNGIMSSKLYDRNGDIIDLLPSAGVYTTSFYIEYGITDRLTVITYAPFFVRAIKNELTRNQSGLTEEGDFVNSFGDTDISFKYGLLTKTPIVVSASVLFGLPIGNDAGGKTRLLQTGDGEFNQMLRVDASHSFYPLPVYASSFGAFNNRASGFSDEVRAGVEVGLTVFKKLTLIGKLTTVQSLFNGSDNVQTNGIFSNNTEFISPEIEIGYSITPRLGISASIGLALEGRNILASPNYGAGIYFKSN
jgi:protein XagA